MLVPAAVEGSWNDVFHRAGGKDRILLSEDIEEVEEAFLPRGQRAIGVVFNPAREAWANYVPTVLPRRYDGFIFIDQTEAVHPLGLLARRDEAPETYPWGM
jgi:erythromycin esterase-like protein